MERRQIDTGGLSFRQIREEGMYYVDKTLLIKDILDRNRRGKFLFVRPRRFGKSVNLSMLDAFFNIRYAGNSWFDGLEISRYREYDRYRNAFPVVHIDLQDAVAGNYEDFIDRMRDIMLKVYRDALDGLDVSLEPEEVHLMDTLRDWTTPESRLTGSANVLCRILRRHYGKDVVVLIDEYDRAVTDSFDSDLQEKIIGFLGSFMSSTLKGKVCVQMAYVTGVMQLAKSGIFSGLNNITVDSLFSVMSDERFGFTEGEVADLLDYYGHSGKLSEVREWYDGYTFGNAEVYNPFSVMSYVSEDCVPRKYWADTGGTKPLVWMLNHLNMEGLGIAASLFDGSQRTVALHESMTYDDLRLTKTEDLFSLMVMTGYCRAVPSEDGYSIELPNREVRGIVGEMLDKAASVSGSLFEGFVRAVMSGDADSITSAIRAVLQDASYGDRLGDEHSYQLVILTLLHYMQGLYGITSQPEEGLGDPDILLVPRRAGDPTVIMELKVVQSKDGLESGIEEAMRQIHEREYYMRMKGRVVLIGMAFFKKTAGCRTEVLDLRRLILPVYFARVHTHLEHGPLGLNPGSWLGCQAGVRPESGGCVPTPGILHSVPFRRWRTQSINLESTTRM
ncbi:MAG: AAA family ATPase [Thermoplasmata archaeon]|nr:AAA family ATPase [Thermoplasmata archaeon]